MDFKELLKAQGLNDEQITSITGAMTKEKIYTTNLEKIDERYGKLKQQKEDLEEQVKTSNTTIADLKKSNKGNEDLQSKVTEYEKTIETLKNESEAKVKKLTLDGAISNILTTNKAKHADLVASKFDREKLVIKDDGTVEGLDEQFKTIKESYKDMFEDSSKQQEPTYKYNPKDGGKPQSKTFNMVDIVRENQSRR